MSSFQTRRAVSTARGLVAHAGWFAGLLLASHAGDVRAHGFAGSRFFPATLTTDDPFVADEMSLPNVSRLPDTPDQPSTRETDVGYDVAKRLLPDLGVEFAQNWTQLHQGGISDLSGFGNLAATIKYQFLLNAEHEAIASIGLNTMIGGTGARRVGAPSYTTYAPTLDFGKGFGDLPESMNLLRPMAVTGLVGYQLPSRASTTSTVVDPTTGVASLNVNPVANQLVWGFALEYSLIYLQGQVRDVGLPKPIDRMIPLVEFAFQTPVARANGRSTTGTINPGVLWAGQYFQLGVEALVPVNAQSGRNIGGFAQLHFYLDDLFRGTRLGSPLFSD